MGIRYCSIFVVIIVLFSMYCFVGVHKLVVYNKPPQAVVRSRNRGVTQRHSVNQSLVYVMMYFRSRLNIACNRLIMVCCFAFGCYCHSRYGKCSFFRFPANKTLFRKWENLCRRKDRSANSGDRLCSCHFKDGKKENGASLFPWNKDKQLDFSDVKTKRPRSRRKCAVPGCHATVTVPTQRLNTQPKHTPLRPHPTGRSGICLPPWTSYNTPSRSATDVVSRITLPRKGLSVANWPRSSSPPGFLSEQDRRLLREKHRGHGFVVCTPPPSVDHNYGITDVQTLWHLRDSKRRSRSLECSANKRHVSVKEEEEAEQLKIEEGANALLNLAGITQESSLSMTLLMLSRPISPVLIPTARVKVEVKSKT